MQVLSSDNFLLFIVSLDSSNKWSICPVGIGFSRILYLGSQEVPLKEKV